MKTLIVIDMQNDFIDGALGTPEAVVIVPKVKKKIEEYRERGDFIFYTRDTHFENYLNSLEGKKLPVKHCIINSKGWQIPDELIPRADYDRYYLVNKHTFGSEDLGRRMGARFVWENEMTELNEIELVGLCTDICVVSNALILKANFPETEITVDASCCAGTTPENHKAALQVMKCCQINVVGE